MKYSLFFLGLILLLSCQSSPGEASIVGSWTMDQDTVKYPKGTMLDKLIFLPNDSLRIEATWDGKMIEQRTGTYSWKKKERLLFTEVIEEKRQFEITKLTDSQMSLTDHQHKVIENYRRL